jgi:hypothetical protein
MPPDEATPSLPWNAEPLTGRSLTMREYLDAVLWWVDRHYRERGEPWHESFENDQARRHDLSRYVQDREERKMIERFAAGESWSAIKASTRGGRLE